MAVRGVASRLFNRFGLIYAVEAGRLPIKTVDQQQEQQQHEQEQQQLQPQRAPTIAEEAEEEEDYDAVEDAAALAQCRHLGLPEKASPSEDTYVETPSIEDLSSGVTSAADHCREMAAAAAASSNASSQCSKATTIVDIDAKTEGDKV